MRDSGTYQLVVAVKVTVFQRGPRATVTVVTIRRHEMVGWIITARLAYNFQPGPPVIRVVKPVGSLADNLRVRKRAH
jgi:hypothetical protein